MIKSICQMVFFVAAIGVLIAPSIFAEVQNHEIHQTINSQEKEISDLIEELIIERNNQNKKDRLINRLSQIGLPVIDVIENILNSSVDWKTRSIAIWILGHMGTKAL